MELVDREKYPIEEPRNLARNPTQILHTFVLFIQYNNMHVPVCNAAKLACNRLCKLFRFYLWSNVTTAESTLNFTVDFSRWPL